MLFRLSNHDVIKPISMAKLVVVMIGTNNVGIGDGIEAVFNGITAVVEKVKEEFWQNVHIVVMGMLPRASSVHNDVIAQINLRLATKYAGHENVHVVNLFEYFLDKRKQHENAKLFMPDHVHPSARGYELILKALKPLLEGHFKMDVASTLGRP